MLANPNIRVKSDQDTVWQEIKSQDNYKLKIGVNPTDMFINFRDTDILTYDGTDIGFASSDNLSFIADQYSIVDSSGTTLLSYDGSLYTTINGFIKNLAGSSIPGMAFYDSTGTTLYGSFYSSLNNFYVTSATGHILIDPENSSEIRLNGDVRVYGDFVLQDTYWDDLRVPVTSVKLGGSKDPDFEVFRTNAAGTSQGVFAYAFANNTEEEIYFTVQIPHDYKLGTDLHPHVHWAVDTVPAGGTTVRWGLEYTIANIGDAFPATTIVYTTAEDPVTQYKHTLSELTIIDGSSIDSVSTMLLCRLFRDVANDDFADDAFLLEIDFHYEKDGFGSDTEYTK